MLSTLCRRTIYCLKMMQLLEINRNVADIVIPNSINRIENQFRLDSNYIYLFAQPHSLITISESIQINPNKIKNFKRNIDLSKWHVNF